MLAITLQILPQSKLGNFDALLFQYNGVNPSSTLNNNILQKIREHDRAFS